MRSLLLIALLLASVTAARADAPTEITLRLPTDCKARRLRSDLRVIYDCAAEETMRVGITSGEPIATPVRREPVAVPSELLAVPRYCPYKPVAALDAQPDRFIVYEDRDVGRCYLYAPLDRAALASLGAYDRRDHLGTLHPYMHAVLLRALAESAAAGHKFKVISGVRPGGKPSWHTFGLAVDINLAHRKGLGEATRAFLAGGDEARAWHAFAEVAERLGLYWLGKKDPDEIFHFEWRPGWTGMPRGDIARDLEGDVERGGPARVWERLRYDPSRPTALKNLRDP